MTNNESDKSKWADFYASRILQAWKHLDPPVEIEEDYAKRLATDLAAFYDDPLKKTLIESTY